MSDIIQLLPDSVANQIAAGEVIQRPASVIKELVENAVDADAHRIDVLVVDAGRTSIQVIDDGKGMSETDARLAFERHATSKIRKADDLFALHTMGFRGEALASVAAVAQIELRTRLRGEELGTHLRLAGSRFVGQEPCACPEGSNFQVENLFYNVPARRKFLKSNTTELNNIVAAFQRIVLVYPHIAFTLHSNGVELVNLRAASLRQRIVDLFGKRVSLDLLPVEADTTLCRIHGFVGKPEAARKKGAHQFFFVNGRYMKHPYFNKAVMNAFERLVPEGEQVPYYLYFDMPPENIDVNIHPTKTEIKFENEQAIWQILSAAVKTAVGTFSEIPAIDFDTEGKPDIPVFGQHRDAVQPQVNYNPQYNPFRETPQKDHRNQIEGWEQLYEGVARTGATQDYFGVPQQPDMFDTAGQPAPTAMADDPAGGSILADKSPAHYQYKGRYIMTAVKSGLMLIDQHRAHVRILYEDYVARRRSRQVESQKILFPEMLQLHGHEEAILERLLPDITALGFEITSLGGGSYAVNAIPAGMEGLNAVTLVTDMLAESAVTGQEPSLGDQIGESLALSLARHAAIPYGEVLSNEAMENLVNRLFLCENVNYTPDGKTILAIWKQADIEHLMG